LKYLLRIYLKPNLTVQDIETLVHDRLLWIGRTMRQVFPVIIIELAEGMKLLFPFPMVFQ